MSLPYGHKVKVHYVLAGKNKGMYAITLKGGVVHSYARELQLKHATSKYSRNLQAKVLHDKLTCGCANNKKCGKRSVHAYVVGTLVPSRETVRRLTKISYNPFRLNYFHFAGTTQEWFGASDVMFTQNGQMYQA